MRLDDDYTLIHSEGEWTDWNKYKVILDSAAYVDVFYNKDLIEDIRYTTNPKEVTTGGCTKLFYEQMDKLTSILKHLQLPADNYYYHEDAVANLISLGQVCKEFRVLFDSGVNNAFYIFNDDDTYVVFTKTRNNLYSLSIFDNGGQNHNVMTALAGIGLNCLGLDQKRAEAVLSVQVVMILHTPSNTTWLVDINSADKTSRLQVRFMVKTLLNSKMNHREIKRRCPDRT